MSQNQELFEKQKALMNMFEASQKELTMEKSQLKSAIAEISLKLDEVTQQNK